MKSTYLRKILRGLRYCALPKLINRQVEVFSLESFESDLFAILGGELPAESRIIAPEKLYLEGAIAKYGLIDAVLSVSGKRLEKCQLISGDTLREFGFIAPVEDRAALAVSLPSEIEDYGFLDSMAEDADKNEALVKLFLRAPATGATGFSAKLRKDYFPQTFTVEDACLTNSSDIWFNKHFYL